MRIVILSLVALPGLAAAAGSCPPVQDTSAERAALVEQMMRATTQHDGDDAMRRMWLLLTGAPSPEAQRLLDRGMELRDGEDLEAARRSFDQLIALCPDYPEGYNQRAFVEFLQADFKASLADLEVVLAMQPNHVAALSGKALVLMGLGRVPEAQAVLRRALVLNPWLPERGMLLRKPGDSL